MGKIIELFRQNGSAVEFDVRLSPSAALDRVCGIYGSAVKISVTAPPEKNMANKALTGLLAKKLKLAKTDVSITGGTTSKNKRVRVAGVTAVQLARMFDTFFDK